MTKGRLEAFTDGVMAVIITIMVLELKVPHGDDLSALHGMGPVFLSYVLSFVYVGIYWNNHHHMLAVVSRVTGGAMWANLHLLFWLSLVPVCTGWVGDHPSAPWPVALYGVALLMAALAWLILEKAIIARNGARSELALAVGPDWKSKVSGLVYAVAIPMSFVRPWAAELLYAAVATIWVVPDRRIEARADMGPEGNRPHADDPAHGQR
ncbi:MAG TPA: TMEM175 family protein [Polyangiaceae bacterium]|nr:TMEM175 family protein [Polyangiaceae bacterium]